MTYKKTYAYVTEKQEHLKALDINNVFMSKDEPILWDSVIRVETGGMYRLGIGTSQTIVALHPSGIELRWSVDLEPRSERGTSVLKLNYDLIREIIEKSPKSVSDDISKWLYEAIDGVGKHIEDLEVGLTDCKRVKSLFEKALRKNKK